MPNDSTSTQPKAVAIQVEDLNKTFGEVRALDGVSFTVYQGELFGYLGPNGAGKTTTINLLTGLARPDSGSICIAGIDCGANPKAAQHLIGVVPDESNLYPELTGFENLCFCAALYGVKKAEREARAKALLESFGLAEAAHRKFAGYSKGMKRKLTIAAALIHQPPLLFLDEPTTGIDVASARHIRQLIANLHEQGTTIFLTTHYIEEAERLCERIALIVAGRIVCIDTVEALRQGHQQPYVVHLVFSNALPGLLARLARTFPDLVFRDRQPGVIQVESPVPVHVAPLVRCLEEAGAEVREAKRVVPSLEEAFVRITGIEAEAMRRDAEKKRGEG
ncbi:MAG: ABC transporter ATP-binding protein [Calditrichaeota bacterium]|nr:ABC transporter ATP-binding protein [Calditrichota bacterium]